MFQEKKVMFLYCVSPLHMGAGTALGAVDNPIQRERHTGHPVMAGSGIKGSLRHHLAIHKSAGGQQADLDILFGPDPEGSAEHAGAVSFSDSQCVLFPVRSLRESFVYATSPTALERLRRMLVLCGIQQAAGWKIPKVGSDDQCVILDDALKASNKKLVLESCQFSADDGGKAELEKVARWISENGLPKDPGTEYFRSKILKHLVLLSDNRFNYFVQHTTVVEPHVRISDESGTAEDGGLFYTENLPAETLMAGMVLCSMERRKKGDTMKDLMQADNVLNAVTGLLDGSLVQMGGDATTGRGQVQIRFA